MNINRKTLAIEDQTMTFDFHPGEFWEIHWLGVWWTLLRTFIGPKVVPGQTWETIDRQEAHTALVLMVRRYKVTYRWPVGGAHSKWIPDFRRCYKPVR
jgi:hypothetical protein